MSASAPGSPGLRDACVLAVGDELLHGAHPDLNTPMIARTLGPLGIAAREARVVGDDERAIAAAVLELAARARLVLVTGGLGPTLDDVTRDGIARAAGVPLRTDPRALADLEAWFAGRGVDMPSTNRRQALLPAGAELVLNGAGTAPGFRLKVGESWVVSLPGPPRELCHVLDAEVVPWLRREGLVGEPLLERRLFLFGVPEGSFAQAADAFMGRDADPLISCSAKNGALWITLRGLNPDREQARQRLAACLEALRTTFAGAIYSEREARIERVTAEALLAAGVSVTTAESCTGGGVAALLTDTPGISRVFQQGFVTYAEAAKVRSLGVAPELLQEQGAVSEEAAVAMAQGAAEVTGARLALGVTGIAGPDGGSPEKPVGLVWFATILDGEVETHQRSFPALGREWVRALAARTALFRVWKRLHARGLARVETDA